MRALQWPAFTRFIAARRFGAGEQMSLELEWLDTSGTDGRRASRRPAVTGTGANLSWICLIDMGVAYERLFAPSMRRHRAARRGN
jgi:hypothetical protein